MEPTRENALRRALRNTEFEDSAIPFAIPVADPMITCFDALVEEGLLTAEGMVMFNAAALNRRAVFCRQYLLTVQGRAAAERLPAAAHPAGQWRALIAPVLAYVERTAHYRVIPTSKLHTQYQREMRALVDALGFRRGQHRLPHVQAEIRQSGTKRAVIALYRLRGIRAELQARGQPLPEVSFGWKMPTGGAQAKPDVSELQARLVRREKQTRRRRNRRKGTRRQYAS